jgi:hypothetical protein
MRYKVLLILSVLALAIFATGSYFASKGKVYIDLGNIPADANVTLKIHENSDNIITKTVQNKSSVTVRSGTYALSLHSGPNSLITVVSVPSFFGTTTVRGDLENEQKRTFVGTNPSPCMMYVANTFYSMACGEQMSSVLQQISPTLSLPGYTITPSTDIVGVVLGTAATNTATYALIENYADDETLRKLVKIGSGLSEASAIDIPPIYDGELAVTASGNRLLAYSMEAKVGYIYDESTGLLQKITLPTADEGLNLVDVSISDKFVVTTYADSQENDGIEGETITGKSTIFVQDANKTVVKHTEPTPYIKAAYCGEKNVCTVGVDGLDIFVQEGDSLKKTTTFPGVNDLFTSGDTVRYVDDVGVKIFDSKTLTGYYEYTTGKYTACGVSASVDGYLLCVIDTKSQKHALFISIKDKAGSDAIDKKVLELVKSRYVSGVNAVNNYIYVIPDYGDVDIFTKDNETTIQVNQVIDSIIRKSTIPKQQYFVINAGAPL